MKAQEARIISESAKRKLSDLHYSIELLAKSGETELVIDAKKYSLNDDDFNELNELGYVIEKTDSEINKTTFITIKW